MSRRGQLDLELRYDDEEDAITLGVYEWPTAPEGIPGFYQGVAVPDPAPEWRSRAACKGLPAEIFYPEQDAGARPFAAARAICATCPVRPQCLEEAMEDESHYRAYGMRAGLTVHQRRALRIARAGEQVMTRLFEVEDKPRYTGTLALVPVGPGCPRCGGELVTVTAHQGALFRHGGYGSTQRTTHDLCLACFWGIDRETIEVNPRSA